MPPKPHPAFVGWHVTGAAFVTQAVAIGFTIGTVAVFAAPLATELGASATEFNLGISLFTLVMNLSMPLIGRALDRGAISRVMSLGALILTASLVGLSRATSLWQVGLCFCGGCAVGMAALGPMPSSAAVASWFEVFRGRALGVANMGGPAGPMLIAPLAAWGIQAIGWRETLLFYAVATACIALPVIRIGIIDRPSQVGQYPDGRAPLVSSDGTTSTPLVWDAGQLARKREFWLLALAMASMMSSGIVMGANSVSYMVELGVTIEAASFVVVLQSGGAILGPLVFGSLADRIHPRLLFVGLIGLLCAMLAGLIFEPSYLVALGLFAFIGVVGGSMMPVYGALVGRLFGAAAFGQVMGLVAVVGLPLVFAGPLGFGLAYDQTGSFGLGLGVMIGVLGVAAGCFALLPTGPADQAKRA